MLIAYETSRLTYPRAVYLRYAFAVKVPGPVYVMRGYWMPTYRLEPCGIAWLEGMN